ncbi:hypothetical protein [Desulfitibacter alkalitolerans]|uniref:hypothetical protein n=1 Tax=Desulfitibacter alkalitolerans TaxID=264641 RepID=UPI000480B428|nr:hypothetical protein [Desulfitibacter alkalitolerans]
MKFYFFSKSQPILRLVSLFILGLIIGSSLTVFSIGSQIDQLSIENESLKHKLTTYESEIEELNESLKKRKYVVTSIEPIISFANQDLTSYDRESYSLEIAKVIKEYLSSLKGKEIENIDYTIVPQVLENRIINVEGQNFVLDVTTLIFSQKVIVYVLVKEYKSI